MKPTVEWDEEYIINLPPGEYDWVEFKGAKSLDFNLPNVNTNKVIDQLSKQISAFSNSGGGTLVYGVKDTSVLPREIDNGGVSLKLRGKSTKEWLEDIIPNTVEFALSEFNVYFVTRNNSESEIAEGKGIFLISIPDSDHAPHQAKDSKYYARVGGKSRPLGHRLVMDIINRSKNPKMELSFWFEENNEDNILQLNVFCNNCGRVYAQYVNGFICLPLNIRSKEDDTRKLIDNIEYTEIYISNIHKDLVNYKGGIPGYPLPGGKVTPGFLGQSYYITRYNPVLPELGFTETIDLNIDLENIKNHKDDKIYWSIYADNCGVANGNITIGQILNEESV